MVQSYKRTMKHCEDFSADLCNFPKRAHTRSSDIKQKNKGGSGIQTEVWFLNGSTGPGPICTQVPRAPNIPGRVHASSSVVGIYLH